MSSMNVSDCFQSSKYDPDNRMKIYSFYRYWWVILGLILILYIYLNIPIQVLWGKKGVIGKQFKPIKIWQKYSKKKVTGFAINSGHFIPEQNPKETIKRFKNFFLKHE